MTATVKPSAVPILGNEEFWNNQGRWKLTVNGKAQENGVDWISSSPFGSVAEAVVLDPKGKPVFTRPIYREAPNVNCVVWGRDESGKAKFAVIRQPRPHSDDPENRDCDDHVPIVFGQIVMGFLERIIGKDLITRYESTATGATREASEKQAFK